MLMLSIITVCYNSEKKIKRTFDSVINQRFKPKEYIVIDGGSTDGTVEIIKEYELLFKNKGVEFKWISEKDNGIYDAMNKGVCFVTQPWIQFLNSDDYYLNDYVLENIKECLSKSNVQIVYGRILWENESRQKVVFDVPVNKLKINYLFGCPVYQPATFYSSLLFEKYKFDTSYFISADYKMFVQMIKDNVKFEFIPRFITLFDEGGISSVEKYNLSVQENIRLLKECDVYSGFVRLSKYTKIYKLFHIFLELYSKL